MAYGSYIPAADYFTPLAQLGQTIVGNLQAGQKQQLLSQLGQQFGTGDYKGAAQTALAGGDLQTAMSLFSMGKQFEADQAAQTIASGQPQPPQSYLTSPAPADASTPRGMRNFNPGNIEDGDFAKSQAGYVGSDGRFARFDTMEHGVGAQSNLLANYGQKGVNTVSGIVSRWAPAAENGAATGNYTAFVAKKLGVGPNDPLDLSNPAVRQRVASAMAEFENGRPVQVADATGAIPANAMPQSDGEIGRLMTRRANIMRALQVPNQSDATTKRLELQLKDTEYHITRLDTQAKEASPSAVREFQFARQNGYTGSFEDFKQLGRATTNVNVDQKSETEFAKASGAGLSKRFQGISEEGDAARQDLALVGQLRDLGGVVQTGGMAAARAWLADKGIKLGDNIAAVEVYSSIIDKLTPGQRVPGSGATSDYEAKLFKSSLPRLINSPEGNAIIMQTLAGLAQSKIDRATIAEKALIGELKPGEAVKQLQALPSPYEAFKGFASGKATPAAPAQQRAPQGGPSNLKPAPAGLLAEARRIVESGKLSREEVAAEMRAKGFDPSF
jgi:hypothetical protein